MHPVWSILANASGKKTVHTGEFVWANVNYVYMNDFNSYYLLQRFKEFGVNKVWDTERLVVIYDHLVPPVTDYTAIHAKSTRDFTRELGLKHVFMPGVGIAHQVMAEKGFARPGMFLHGGDSHSPTIGALGLLSVAGNSDLTCSATTGRLWMRIPEIVEIQLNGSLAPGVTSHDLIYYIGSLGLHIESCVVEFTGSTVAAMALDDRMALTNMVVDEGVESAYIHPDEKVKAFLRAHPAQKPGEELELPPGEKSDYARTIEIESGNIPPYIAKPHTHANGVPIDEVAGIKIDQAVIGSCGGGKLEDMRRAAAVLKGRKIHPSARMIVAPASSEAMLAAIREGLIETFIDAGAQIDIIGCGACFGYKHTLAAGETCITNTTRNHRGRMGSPESNVYLGSATNVAAAAVAGEIIDARNL